MLSFDVSIVDIVLVLAVMVLLILYTTRQSTKSVAEPELSVPREKDVVKPLRPAETQRAMEETRLQTGPQTSSVECPRHFGYLKKLPKDASIPEECFRCSKMTECFCK